MKSADQKASQQQEARLTQGKEGTAQKLVRGTVGERTAWG